MLVQVEVALTDGTDLKAFRRGHPVLLGELPSPFGHEFCGIDVATGRRVVAANSAAGDERGEPLELLNGAYAELLLVPERDRARSTSSPSRRARRRRSPRWSSRSRAACAASSGPRSRRETASRSSAPGRSG